MRTPFRLTCLILLLLAPSREAGAQAVAFDPSWPGETQTWLKLAVAEDGVYRVTAAELEAAGVPQGREASFRLLENGTEIPLLLEEGGFYFVGRRHRGRDEVWAYDGRPGWQSSTFHSLYTDTTYYWLAWGDTPGPRYQPAPAPTAPPPQTTTRDTLHVETNTPSLYYAGDSGEAGDPRYTRGEGFYGWRFRHNTSPSPLTRTFDVALPHLDRSSGAPLHLRVRLNGATASRHRVRMEALLEAGSGPAFAPVDTVEWSGYAFATLTATVSPDQLPGDGLLRLRLTSENDFGSSIPNIVYHDWIEVVYTRTLEAPSGRLRLAAEADGPTRFVLSAWPTARALVFDPSAARYADAVPAGGEARLELDVRAGAPLWAASPETARSVPRIARTEMAPWPGAGAGYVIVAPRALRASAEAHAAYRATPEGGGHTTRVLLLEDLLDRFDYGRPRPVALRRLVRAALAWDEPARFLTLWGDALYPSPDRSLQPWEVPSFGRAASDAWFAMQLEGPDDWTEALAVGRVPVRTEAQGALFLDKMRTYEAAPFADWQKRSIFLSGGTSVPEQSVLRNHTLAWSRLAATPPTGLDTLHFFKRSDQPLDPTFKDSLDLALRKGAAWLSYFGHSANQTWEIVTDPPAEFDNAGRWPVVLSLGCYTGDFALGSGTDLDPVSLAEQLVVRTDNGSVAHWGASSAGYISESAALSNRLHTRVFADTARVLGPTLQAAKADFAADFSYPRAITHLLLYGLVGDPGQRIRLPERPDFALAAEHVVVRPATPVPADQTVEVEVRLQNVGLVPADSLVLRLAHHRPDGATKLFERRVAPFARQTTVRFDVPIDEGAVGDNRFEATADPEGRFAEEDETNNRAVRVQTVFASGVVLLTPAAFGLVPTTDPVLQLSVATPSPEGAAVVMQLDTVATFDSPSRLEARRAGVRGVVRWEVTGLDAGRPYYWRARVEAPGEAPVWKTRSFTARPALGLTGWYQGGDQFEAAETDALLAYEGGAWRFARTATAVTVTSERGSGEQKGQFVVDGELYERLGFGFGLMLIDGATGAIRAHGSMPTYENTREDPAEAFAELKALAALADQGDYVFVRTRHLARTGPAVIADSVKAVFRDLGSAAIDTLTYSHLWIAQIRVGHPEVTVEVVEAPGGVNEIVRDFEVPVSLPEGTVTSPPIGPAAAWQTLGWEAVLANDAQQITVDVLDAATGALLLPDLSAPPLELASLSAPTIRLRARLSDVSQRGTPQLTSWYVGYRASPELALAPEGFTLSSDTLLVGAPLEVALTVDNLTGTPADTAVVAYELIDADGTPRPLGADTLRGVAGATPLARTFETADLAGAYTLQVRVASPAHPEITTTDNVLVRRFYVTPDASPPQFEVFVEGASLPPDPSPVGNLQDPAIPFVSLRPTIEITASDDNPFLRLEDDTSAVVVTLDGRRIPHAALQVVSGTDGLRLVFEPELAARDTVHTLTVAVRDRSGNEAEGSPYQVHVRTQSSVEVESLYPYPNPMSTATTFAFRLRGAEARLVEDFRLRIYTLHGRLVREFDLVRDPSGLEAGALRIGWNLLRWDGRDADGDPLATGVYLYKVWARAEGEALRVNNRTGIEKLAIIR